jgi:hypothetical protein
MFVETVRVEVSATRKSLRIGSGSSLRINRLIIFSYGSVEFQSTNSEQIVNSKNVHEKKHIKSHPTLSTIKLHVDRRQNHY